MKNILILLTAVMFVTSAQAVVCSDYDGDQNSCNSNQECQYETTDLKCGSAPVE